MVSAIPSKTRPGDTPATTRISGGLDHLLKEIRDEYHLGSVLEASEHLMDEILSELAEAEDFLHPVVHESQKLSRQMKDRQLEDYARVQEALTAMFRATLRDTEKRQEAVEFAHTALIACVKYAKGEVDYPIEYVEEQA